MLIEVNWFLYLAVFSVNLLTLNTTPGFSWSSPSIPKLLTNDTTINPLEKPISLTEESCIATFYAFGCIFGTVLAALIAEKLGRKKALVLFGVPYIVFYLVLAFGKNVYLYIASRFILGLSAGCVLSVLPTYVAEISEPNSRGFFSSLFSFFGSLGHIISFGIGPLVSFRTFNLLLTIPVLLFFVTFAPLVPESPYYFLAQQKKNKAEKCLGKLRNGRNVEKEITSIQEFIDKSHQQKSSLSIILSSSKAQRGLVVCCGLFIFQQFMGIAIFQLYLQQIVEATNNLIPSDKVSLIIAIVQVGSCLLSTLLIDKLGRKMLLYISSFGSAVSLFSLGLYFLLQDRGHDLNPIFWLPTLSLIIYYIFFNIGFNTVPYIMTGELFSVEVKSICVAFSFVVNMSVAVAIGASFPYLRTMFGISGVMILFSALTVIASVFVYSFVPETKGKTFQEIQILLDRRGKSSNQILIT